MVSVLVTVLARKYRLIWVSVLDQNQNSGFGRTLTWGNVPHGMSYFHIDNGVRNEAISITHVVLLMITLDSGINVGVRLFIFEKC